MTARSSSGASVPSAREWFFRRLVETAPSLADRVWAYRMERYNGYCQLWFSCPGLRGILTTQGVDEWAACRLMLWEIRRDLRS